MKQTILHQPAQTLSKRLTMYSLLCVFAAAATFGINLLLAFTFTEKTRLAYLLINIGADIVIGSLILLLSCAYLQPRRKLLRLARQKGSTYTGRVESISESSLRYLGIDCREVLADGRRLFLPCGTIRLEEGVCYRFQTVSNVITEAEQ